MVPIKKILTKSHIKKSLLSELDNIDKRREKGRITKKRHDVLSSKAVDKALKKLK